MRTLCLLLIVMASCAKEPPGTPGAHCGEPDSFCGAKCQTEVEDFRYEDCCDSVTCNCRPSTGEWEVWYCDAPPPPDAGVPSECSACQPGEVCVVDYDGLCTQLGARCVTSTCDACTPECDEALCRGRDAGPTFTCQATPCTTLPERVFGCYGP